MAEQIPPFLKRKDLAILFNSDGELNIFVPEKFFDLRMAFSVGPYINLFGVANYCIIDKNGKKSDLKTLNIPTRFLTKPYQVDKLKSVKLISTSKPQDYRVFRYRKDDVVIVETKVPQEIENVEDFINLFVITGNIPTTIPYDKLQSYFVDNIAANGNSYGINLQIFGIVISELCRDPKDINKPFRLSGNKNMTDYNPISVKSVSKLINAYSALTSENFTDAAAHAMMNDKIVDSPLERVMVGDEKKGI